MSGKTVEERRLRLVNDALEIYNSKKALKESDKVLKKHPDMHTAKVLRALALIRLERLGEAMDILDDVQGSVDSYDESLLSAFVRCFKELGQPEKISTVFEKAVAAAPDETLYSHLFLSYARTCNYKDQQKTALALHRQYPSQPYYLWAIMSVLMQATESPELGEKMLLPLAQKMLTKVYDENNNKWDNAQELELAVIAMQKQGRHAEAADLLDSPAAAELLSDYSKAVSLIRVLKLRVAAKQWQTVLERTEEALNKVESVDQWLLWTMFFDSAFALADECKDEDEKRKIIDRAFATVRKACEVAPANRGPSMAHLDFVSRTIAAGLYDAEKYGDTVALLLAFARRFHSRPSCFVDMSKWLNMVGDDRRTEVETGIASLVDSLSALAMRKAFESEQKEDDLDMPISGLAECLSIEERVRRWYGTEVAAGPEQRRSRVLRLARGHARTSRVKQPAATFAFLAAEGLYMCYRKDGDTRALYEALLLLETAIRNCQEDHLSKLALMHIYSLLGIPSRMRLLLDQVDSNRLSLDSHEHLGFHAAEFGGQVDFGSLHFTILGNQYDRTDREISEYIVTAYTKGAFAQIEEIAGLRRKMRRSIMATASVVANSWIWAAFSINEIDHIIAIMKGEEDPGEEEEFDDNRDYTIFPAADQQLADEIKAYSAFAKEEMFDISLLRQLIMRVSASVASGTIEEGRELWKTLSEQLEQCGKKYTEEQAPPPALVNTPPSYLGEWVHGPFLAPILRLLSSTLDAIEVAGDERKEAELLPSESELSSMFAACVDTVRAAIDKAPTKNTVLQLSTVMRLVSRSAQSIAFCRQLLRLISHRLVGEKTTASKKSVKDALAAMTNAVKEAIDSLGEQMERAREKLDNNFEDCFPTVDEAFWNEEWATLLKLEKKEVDMLIARSQCTAMMELQACLKS